MYSPRRYRLKCYKLKLSNKHFMYLGVVSWFTGLLTPMLGHFVGLDIHDSCGVSLGLCFLAIIIWCFNEHPGSAL